MKEIPLTRGMVAKVSDEDFDHLSKYKWSVVEASGYFYARRAYWEHSEITGKTDKYVSVPMHRFIMGNPVGMVVDHINGDTLDNRRDNLRTCTYGENNRNSHRSSKSGYRGVLVLENGWFRPIYSTFGTKPIPLGNYKNPKFAAEVFDAAVVAAGDTFTRRNFDYINEAAMNQVISAFVGNPVPGKPRKLTDKDVVDIRTRYAAGGVKGKDFAREYGVCVATVYHAISGRTFSHIQSPPPDTADRRREKVPA